MAITIIGIPWTHRIAASRKDRVGTLLRSPRVPLRGPEDMLCPPYES
jgi:hypothetical protein